MVPGQFLSFEGIDGAGKSTHIQWLHERLLREGIEHVVTREPGGTPLGEKIRELLLNDAMELDTEALLMFASRREHMAKVVLPALSSGRWVVSDRFIDSSYAYQCGGRGMDQRRLDVLTEWVLDGALPDMTFLFDVPLDVSQARIANGRLLDRFEQEEADFHARVRCHYLTRAASAPARIKLIDASEPIDQVQSELERHLQPLLAKWNHQ